MLRSNDECKTGIVMHVFRRSQGEEQFPGPLGSSGSRVVRVQLVFAITHFFARADTSLQPKSQGKTDR